MEYHLVYKYFEEKTINKAGELFKKYLINGLIDDREFNLLYNNCLKELGGRSNEIFSNSNQELNSFLTLFNDRTSFYNKNFDEHILENELYNMYKKSPIRKTVTYKGLILKLAVYTGLNKSYSIISNKRSFFELIYNKNEFKKFIFINDFNDISKAEQKLLNKYYPKRGGNIIDFDSLSDNTNSKINEKNKLKKVNDDIDLFGVRFNLNEFALYNREWKNFKKHNTVSFKDIFDKVMMDFNDPYNYLRLNRSYDGTPFYKALQEDKPLDKKNFNVEVAFNKIMNLTKKVGNDKFLKYIEARKSLFVN